MKKTGSSLKAFWEHKARRYPLPFETLTAARTARMVRRLEAMGVAFRGRSLVDIGCGTGIYGLFLADRLSRTLGVDFSGEMLARFRAQARARKIKNAACLRIDWRSAKRLPGAPFDIALAAMSMAVRNPSDIARMEDAALENCVYIGWAGKRKNRFMERIFSAHGLEYETPDNGREMVKTLKKLRRRVKTVFIQERWPRTGTYRETLREVMAHLKLNNVPVRRQWLEKFIKARGRNGRIKHTTLARKVVIVWRPPKKRGG